MWVFFVLWPTAAACCMWPFKIRHFGKTTPLCLLGLSLDNLLPLNAQKWKRLLKSAKKSDRFLITAEWWTKIKQQQQKRGENINN